MNEDVDLEASGMDSGAQSNSQATSNAERLGKPTVSHAKTNAQKESFWHEKPHLPCSKHISAHIAIIATKSIYF